MITPGLRKVVLTMTPELCKFVLIIVPRQHSWGTCDCPTTVAYLLGGAQMITCCPPTQPALKVCAHQLKQLWHFAPTNSSSCGTLRQPTHSTLPPCVNLRAHRSRSPKYAHCPHYSYHYEWCTPCTKDYATRTILLRRRAVQAQHLRHLWLCLPKRGASVGHFESPWRHLVQILMLSVRALGWLHLAPAHESARLQRIV